MTPSPGDALNPNPLESEIQKVEEAVKKYLSNYGTTVNGVTALALGMNARIMD